MVALNIELSKLSIKELQDLKIRWFKEATDEHLLELIYKIGRYLGESVSANYGPKYRYNKEGLSIYIDDYGNYFTAEYEGKLMCDTHFCKKIFIRGDWENSLTALIPAVNVKIEEINAIHHEAERQRLINELS